MTQKCFDCILFSPQHDEFEKMLFYLQCVKSPNIINQKGFTLIEMLVVLVVIGLSLGVVMLNISKKTQKTQPEIILFLEKQQQYAIQHKQRNDIQLKKGMIYATASRQHLPVNSAPPFDSYLPYRTLTVFFPDGMISLSQFSIYTDTNEYEIKTDPFYGKIRYTQHAIR